MRGNTAPWLSLLVRLNFGFIPHCPEKWHTAGAVDTYTCLLLLLSGSRRPDFLFSYRVCCLFFFSLSIYLGCRGGGYTCLLLLLSGSCRPDFLFSYRIFFFFFFFFLLFSFVLFSLSIYLGCWRAYIYTWYIYLVDLVPVFIQSVHGIALSALFTALRCSIYLVSQFCGLKSLLYLSMHLSRICRM